jgi:alkane 1-monooxygenase
MYAFRYTLCFLPMLIAIAGNLLGGFWAAGNIFFSLAFMVIIDWFAPADRKKIPQHDSGLPDAVLLCSVAIHTLGLVSLIYGVWFDILVGGSVWLAAVSTGFAAGILGITVAHELIHRERDKWMQHLGIWNLFIVCYAHFFTEHRLVHHVKVGTAEDPATARHGESFYAFLVRTVPAQYISALQTDARIQQRKGLRPYGWYNFTVRAYLLQLTFMALIHLGLGGLVLGAFIVQSVAAFFLLEYVNYIENYGLVRANGERVGKQHAWQSDSISSRFTLFELSRHADHHMRASKPYYTLDSHDESPRLLAGYFGMFYLALIPPLFFKGCIRESELPLRNRMQSSTSSLFAGIVASPSQFRKKVIFAPNTAEICH